jgi:hypothetical protein
MGAYVVMGGFQLVCIFTVHWWTGGLVVCWTVEVEYGWNMGAIRV